MSVINSKDILPPRNVVQIKKLQGASRRLDVIPYNEIEGVYLVQASTGERFYTVTLDAESPSGDCTCPWAQHGGINCKHVLAALRVHYAAQGAVSFWRTPIDARRQHRRTVRGNQLYATLRPHNN